MILLMGTLAPAQNVKPAAKARGVVVPPGQTQNGLAVEIVPVADGSQMRVLTPERGVLDFGTFSAAGHSNPGSSVRRTAKSMVVTSEFALRVTGDAGAKAQPVTIHGFVTHVSPAQRFRLNGQPLSATPVIIARNVMVGAVNKYRLEIEIPYSSTEADSSVNASLGFTVSTD